MITSVTRKGREILLETPGEKCIHLTLDRATAIARQLGRLDSITRTQVLYQEARNAGYTFALIASPERGLVVVGLVGGEHGDVVAGWPYSEIEEAREALARAALDITTRKTSERKKRAA